MKPQVAEEGVQEAGAARAVQAGQADDLALPDTQVAYVQALRTAQPPDVERQCLARRPTRLALQQRLVAAEYGFDQDLFGRGGDGKGIDGAAVAQHRHAVADGPDLAKAVADIQDCDAQPGDLAYHLEDALQLGLVQGRRRFIHDDDLGVHGQRPGDGGELLVGDGERAHGSARAEVRSDPGQGGLGHAQAPGAVDHAPSSRYAAEQHVLRHGQLRHQVEFLVDHRDARERCFLRRAEAARNAIEQQGAARQRMGAGNDLQERALAGTVCAEQAMHLAAPDRERRILHATTLPEKILAAPATSSTMSSSDGGHGFGMQGSVRRHGRPPGRRAPSVRR